MSISHYWSSKTCKKPEHVKGGQTLRYRKDNKCVECRKMSRTIYKNCCPVPTKKKQVELWINSGVMDERCKNWWGAKYSNGYGHFSSNGKDFLSHRYALSVYLRRSFKPSVVICHTCDNPACINPLHLFPGSHRVNALDKISKGRARLTPLKGEDHPNCKLTNDQVAQIRSKFIPREYTKKKLAEEYNVSESLIAKILSGKARKDGTL